MKPVRINFIGIPFSGKTYWAIQTAALLKRYKYSVEFIEEPFKDWAYFNYPLPSLADEIVGFGKQLKKELNRLEKGVTVITDAGLPTICYYLEKYTNINSFLEIIKSSPFPTTNILLKPLSTEKFNCRVGRWDKHLEQLEEDYVKFKNFLDKNTIEYVLWENPTDSELPTLIGKIFPVLK
ncbi:MAG: hypothetical protein KatS3mg087_0103 [Patescibacteria group bacterium]|nr:MAG: hypothetical protein KatS3mg087_0103 [Patescibacteria group bacterium]